MHTLFSPGVGRRAFRRRRQLGTALVAAFMVATVPAVALAAAPPNDAPGGAVALTSLPSSISLDTTAATVAGDDLGCGAGGQDQASVWYTLTLPADTRVLIDATASSYDVGVNVFEGAPSPDSLVDCVEGGVVFDATAGTTYTIMFADIDGGANGGDLEAALTVGQPAVDITLKIDPTAKSNAKTGEAVITGTLSCSAETENAFVDVKVTEPVGRFTVHGFGGADATCGPTPTHWVAFVTGDNGKFLGGKAAVQVDAVACQPFVCADTFADATVRIRR